MSGDWPNHLPAGRNRDGGDNLDNGPGTGGNGDLGPEISDIAFAAAGGITISGSGFGAAKGASKVTFLTGAPGAVAVEPTYVTWSDSEINVTPPAFSVGGAVAVTVQRGIRRATDYINVPEPAPMQDVHLTVADVIAGAPISVTGLYFGYPVGAGGIPPPGAAFLIGSTEALNVRWARDHVTGVVPGTVVPGQYTVTVERAPGVTAAAAPALTVHATPRIDRVTPASAPPGAVVGIDGGGFGALQGGGTVAFQGTDGNYQLAEVVTWKDGHIEARIPGRVRLGWGPGPTQVKVAAQWGSPATHAVTVTLRPSITSWARIEAHQRADDLQRGLRLGLQARVHDAAWLLATQWRLREYELEDAGSPISVSVEAEQAPLQRWRPDGGKAARLPTSIPLEALVEREQRGDGGTVRWSRRRAVETGMQFFRLLGAEIKDAARLQQLRQAYLRLFPMKASADPVDLPTRRFLELVTGRAPDGAAMYVALRKARPAPAGTGTLPNDPKITTATERASMLKVIDAWYRWCDAVVSEGAPADRTWLQSRNEYAFAVSADTPREAVLVAREYDGGTLDWHDFVLDRSAPPLRDGNPVGVTPLRATTLPAPVTYAGMPAPRWWQFEDATVDFGGVDAAPADLARLLIVEFATVYGNDWYVVPLANVIPGSVVRVMRVAITNTFGDPPITIPRLAAQPAAKDLHLFELTAVGAQVQGAPEPSEYLFFPATVRAGLEGTPVERVDFVRDELANMAWGVETIVESPLGTPSDQGEAYAAEKQRGEIAEQPATSIAPLVYRLRTEVPRYWIPLVPVAREETLWFMRAAMPDSRNNPVSPRGRILEGTDVYVYDEEIPREGAQVTRSYQYARAADGTPSLWVSRRRRPGALGTTSGLRFDTLDPSP